MFQPQYLYLPEALCGCQGYKTGKVGPEQAIWCYILSRHLYVVCLIHPLPICPALTHPTITTSLWLTEVAEAIMEDDEHHVVVEKLGGQIERGVTRYEGAAVDEKHDGKQFLIRQLMLIREL